MAEPGDSTLRLLNELGPDHAERPRANPELEHSCSLPSAVVDAGTSSSDIACSLLRATQPATGRAVCTIHQAHIPSHPSQDPVKSDARMAALPLLHHSVVECRLGREAHSHAPPTRRHQHRTVDVDGPLHAHAPARRHT